MAKADLKTKATNASPAAVIAALEYPTRKADAETLLAFFDRVTGLPAKMWGPSMIGYGRYAYRYESGREGEYFMTGFSARKTALSIYIMPGYADLTEMLSRLGKHKMGKSCLYINKLADVDMAVLEEMVR
ncbi:MAG: DUF1801 domain-containing protein, partial [Pseudomonadota bacterium]